MLAPFADLERLALDTGGGGEFACVFRGSQTSIVRRFERFAAREQGIVGAHLTLTLHCLDADGRHFNIRGGAEIVIQAPFNKLGEIDETSDEFDLRLRLNVDIYSPRNP